MSSVVEVITGDSCILLLDRCWFLGGEDITRDSNGV